MSTQRVLSVLLIAAATAAFLRPAMAQEFTVVVPNGLEAKEGESTSQENPSPSGGRLQYLMSSSQFASVPTSHGLISQISLRPDSSLMAPRTTIWEDFTMRLSTTSQTVLSQQFDANLGDDVTTVYEGAYTVTTQNTGPAAGPKDFDIHIDLSPPFPYGPGDGNLVLDMVHGSHPPNQVVFDAASEIDGAAPYVGGNDPNAMTAQFQGTEAVVMQFTFVPEPSSALLGLLALGGLLVFRRQY